MGSLLTSSCARKVNVSRDQKWQRNCDKQNLCPPSDFLEWTPGQVENGIIPITLQPKLNSSILSQSFGCFPNRWELEIFILRDCISNFDPTSEYTNTNPDMNGLGYVDDHDEDWNDAQVYSMNVSDTIDQRFYIRVPFSLIRKQINIKIALKCCDQSFKSEHNHPSKYKELQWPYIISESHTIEIPSVLFDRTFGLGDKVMVNYPKSMVVHPAVITCKKIRMADNKIIRINNVTPESDPIFADQLKRRDGTVIEYTVRCMRSSSHDIISLNVLPSQIFPPTDKWIQYSNIVDTCNTGNHRLDMECDLILRSKDKTIRQFYLNLRGIVSQILSNSCNHTYRYRVEATLRYNFEFLGAYFSNVICNYLYDLDNHDNNMIKSRYQIRCFQNSSFGSEDGFLCLNQLWTRKICNQLTQIRLGVEHCYSIQDFTSSEYRCDLCNVWLHDNDWVFSCHRNAAHDYCLPCVYSMAHQIVKFEKYLQSVINDCYHEYLTMDCIQILVAFVLGYANVRILTT